MIRGRIRRLLGFYDRDGKIAGRLLSDETFRTGNAAAVRCDNPWLIPSAVSHRFYGESLTAPASVKKFTPAGRGLPACTLRCGGNHLPMLTVNGRTMPLNHYWGPADRINPVQVANCMTNNIHQYWLSCQFEWLDEGKYDFSAVDKACRKLLALDPQALILLELPVDSFANPSMAKWCRLHPQETARDENGDNRILVHGVRREVPSWASDLWLQEAKQIMAAAVKYVASREYAPQVIGFFPLAGLGHEWAYYGCHDKLYLDYSSIFQKQLQRFAPGVRMPTRAEREAANGVLDQERDCNLIAFRKFLSERTALVIDEIGRAVKEAGQNKPLYGTYYGYTTYTAVENWNENGHFALKKLLSSPNIDFLVSIVRYDNRGAGQESGAISPVASHWLNGKACVLQSNLRTHRAAGRKDWVIRDLRGSMEVIKREIAWALISGASFEFGYYGYGWMAGDVRLMQLWGRGQELSEQLAAEKEIVSGRGIAFIVDEEALAHIGQNSKLPRRHIREKIPQIARAGTGYDIFLLSDFAKLKDKGYRCFLFPNSVWLSESDRQLLLNNFPQDASAVVFPPGTVSVPDGVQLVSGNADWSAVTIQDAARKAGVPIRNANCGDATMASGNLLAIHTGNQGGKRILAFPDKKCRTAVELFTGKSYPVRNGEFQLEVKPATTYFFKARP